MTCPICNGEMLNDTTKVCDDFSKSLICTNKCYMVEYKNGSQIHMEKLYIDKNFEITQMPFYPFALVRDNRFNYDIIYQFKYYFDLKNKESALKAINEFKHWYKLRMFQ